MSHETIIVAVYSVYHKPCIWVYSDPLLYHYILYVTNLVSECMMILFCIITNTSIFCIFYILSLHALLIFCVLNIFYLNVLWPTFILYIIHLLTKCTLTHLCIVYYTSFNHMYSDPLLYCILYIFEPNILWPSFVLSPMQRRLVPLF